MEDGREPGEPLTVGDLRLGMLIRIKRGFRDFDGQEIAAGETLRFQTRTSFHHDGGHTLYFEAKVFRLAGIVPETVPLIENDYGAYFDLVRAVPTE